MRMGFALRALTLALLLDGATSLAPSFLGRPGPTPASHGSPQKSTAWNPKHDLTSMLRAIPQALVTSPAFPDFADTALRLPIPPIPTFKPKQDAETVVDHERAADRRKMREDAALSSKLALQFYFQAVSMKKHAAEQEAPVRLDRSCPTGAEVYRKSFGGNDCVICKGDVCELAEDPHSHPEFRGPPSMKGMVMDLLSELSHGHRALSGFTGQEEEMKETEVDEVPIEVSWHESLSQTLRVLGVRNHMDSTMHEGVHYMDVVIDRASNPHLRWGESRGLVLQLLTANTLRGESETNPYVKLKTEAIQRGRWTALSVPWHEWSALTSDVERISWLAIKLAALDLFENPV